MERDKENKTQSDFVPTRLQPNQTAEAGITPEFIIKSAGSNIGK